MFVLVFYLCSSQSFLNLNLLWSQDENRTVNPEAHGRCWVSVLQLTICQLSAHLIIICLLNENLLVLTTIQVKILPWRFFFLLFFVFFATFDFGCWSLIITSSFNDTYFSDTPLSQDHRSWLLKTVCHSSVLSDIILHSPWIQLLEKMSVHLVAYHPPFAFFTPEKHAKLKISKNSPELSNSELPKHSFVVCLPVLNWIILLIIHLYYI